MDLKITIFVLAHLIIGSIIAHFYYMKKIMTVYYNDFSTYPPEPTVVLAIGCMTFFWEFLLPIEFLTKFKLWKKKGGD